MRSQTRSEFREDRAKKVKNIETSELKVLGKNRQHRAGKKKRARSLKHAGSQLMIENEDQPETTLSIPQKVKEPIIKIYSEDSGRAATDYADDNYGKVVERNDTKMETQLSQETQVTELRMESLHSQDDLLAHNNQKKAQIPMVTKSWNMGNNSKLPTMASQASTEVDPFRSRDCLILNSSAQVKQSKSYSLCCLNFIAETINGLSYNTGNESQKNSKPHLNGQLYSRARLSSSFRGEGRVTTGCLWHACRAVTIGICLVITGITLTVIGEGVLRIIQSNFSFNQ